MLTTPSGTREQIAVGDWLDRASLIRPNLATAAEKVPTVLPYFDSLTSVVACFGHTELVARRFDRAEALGLLPDRGKALRTEVTKRNEAGLAHITVLRSTLGQLEKDLAASKLSKGFVSRRLKETSDEFKLALVDWDMKGSDAKKIAVVLDEMVGLVSKEGVTALPRYLDGKFAELEEVRRRPDRGAIDNIPWWKILIIVGMVGWWIIQVLWCDAFGCVPASVAFWWLIQAIHAVAFVLFC
jgi:hypothetical protein